MLEHSFRAHLVQVRRWSYQMKRWKLQGVVAVVLAIACLVGLLGCAVLTKAEIPPPSDDLNRLRDEVAHLCGQMEQAMRDNDLVKVASYYWDDAILLGKSGNKRGGTREAIDTYWKGFGTGIDWLLSVDSIEGVDNLIVHRGRSLLTYIKDGERRTSEVQFVLLWQRSQDGVLRIAVDAYW